MIVQGNSKLMPRRHELFNETLTKFTLKEKFARIFKHFITTMNERNNCPKINKKPWYCWEILSYCVRL